jgi:tetratricopeptide (TPR) repeat protein
VKDRRAAEALPDDVFDRADGGELVGSALASALRGDRAAMLDLVERADEAIDVGLAMVALAVAAVGAAHHAGDPKDPLVGAAAEAGDDAWPILAERFGQLAGSGSDDDELLAPLLGVAGRLADRHGDSHSAVLLARAALDRCEAVGDPLLRAAAEQSVGAALSRAGRREEAEPHSLRAQAVYERIDDRQRLASVLSNRAQDALTDGDPDKARALLRRVLALAADTGDRRRRDQALQLIAMTDLLAGDVDRAEHGLRDVVARARRTGDLDLRRVAAQNLAALLSEHRGPAAALRWQRRALRLAEETGEPLAVEELSRSLGTALAVVGDLPAAEEQLRQAVSVAEVLGDPFRIAAGRADLAAVLVASATGTAVIRDSAADGPHGPAPRGRSPSAAEWTARLDEAVALLRRAADAFADLGDDEWLDRTIGNLAVALREQGEPRAAAAALAERAAGHAAPSTAADLFQDAARLLLAAGEPDDALRLARRAAEDRDDAAPWRLATSAADAAGAGHPAVARTLFEEALARIAPDQRTGPLAADIRNDLALALAEIGEHDQARALLARNADDARLANNRVELAKAVANLAEMNRRNDEHAAAAEQLSEAAALYAAMSDYDNAAEQWALLAHASLVLDRLSAARQAAHRAARSADAAGTATAAAAAARAHGHVRHAEGHHLAAAVLCLAAAPHETGLHRAESRAAALTALAELGDWPRYRHVLRIVQHELHADPTAAASAAPALAAPAAAWLAAGRPRRAAGALVLALTAAIRGYLDADLQSRDGSSLLAETFVRAAQALDDPGATPADRTACRRAVLARLRRQPELAELVDNLLNDAAAALRNSPDEPLP